MPSDVARSISKSEFPVTVKETCFGLILSGQNENIRAVVEKIRLLDKNHIFVKDRGFPAGDKRRCRASRGGGPRPGFHFLREEVNMLPAIGAALDELDAKEPDKEKYMEKYRLKVSDLEKVVENKLQDEVLTKIFIYPINSLILADLVERFGHKPLTIMSQIRKKVTNISINSPPINIVPEDPKLGLRYAAIEIPPGVRGRMTLIGPLIEEAEAAILAENSPTNFGCLGCNRTNELVKYLIRSKEVPILEVKYPESSVEASKFVNEIAAFLVSLHKKAEREYKLKENKLIEKENGI
jgi:putative methanogenesis marker protein 5/putative methanogenesis marker protein 6